MLGLNTQTHTRTHTLCLSHHTMRLHPERPTETPASPASILFPTTLCQLVWFPATALCPNWFHTDQCVKPLSPLLFCSVLFLFLSLSLSVRLTFALFLWIHLSLPPSFSLITECVIYNFSLKSDIPPCSSRGRRIEERKTLGVRLTVFSPCSEKVCSTSLPHKVVLSSLSPGLFYTLCIALAVLHLRQC